MKKQNPNQQTKKKVSKQQKDIDSFKSKKKKKNESPIE